MLDNNITLYHANWSLCSQMVRVALYEKGISFNEIYAIQIVSEKLKNRRRKNSKSLRGKFTRYYYSYEINLVLNDSSRVSVIDHGDQKVIRNDALKIAEFLDIPVWDIS